MALDSTSTLAEIYAQYADNVGYQENDSLSQCALFIQAAELLLLKLPRQESAAAGNETLMPNVDGLERRLVWAKQWHALRQATGSAVHPSFEEFRT